MLLWLLSQAHAGSLLELPGVHRDPTRWMIELRSDVPWTPELAALPLRFPNEPSLARFRVSRTLPTGAGVLRVWRPFLAVPPPDSGDTAGPTPDFRPLQTWLDGDFGIGADETARFTSSSLHQVADVEYGWQRDHEDLGELPTAFAWGWDSELYAFHGTSVLGMLRATRNGLGVDGAVGNSVLVISPFSDETTYDVGAAVLAARDLLSAGDVLLIEQQGEVDGDYCPIEIDPGVYAAIERATNAGITVVEPGGNGGQDLDDPRWEGVFDRDQGDSGAVLVGGGASPTSSLDTRSWTSSGSSYGSRLDVQGWYDSVVTATNGEYGQANLWYPDEDPTRAYTDSFSGTSAAAPMVAAVALIAQDVRTERTGAPWSPADLREVLVSTGLPQPVEQTEHIGPQPNLRTLLRTYGRP